MQKWRVIFCLLLLTCGAHLRASTPENQVLCLVDIDFDYFYSPSDVDPDSKFKIIVQKYAPGTLSTPLLTDFLSLSDRLNTFPLLLERGYQYRVCITGGSPDLATNEYETVCDTIVVNQNTPDLFRAIVLMKGNYLCFKMNGFYFHKNSSKVDTSSLRVKEELKILYSSLSHYPAIGIRFYGRASRDETNPDELSRRRCLNLIEWFSTYGINAGRFQWEVTENEDFSGDFTPGLRKCVITQITENSFKPKPDEFITLVINRNEQIEIYRQTPFGESTYYGNHTIFHNNTRLFRLSKTFTYRIHIKGKDQIITPAMMAGKNTLQL